MALPIDPRAACPGARRRTAAALAVPLLAAPLAGAAAQQHLGGGEDATLPRPGEVRVRAQPSFLSWDETYGAPGEEGSSRRRPLGARFTRDSLGAETFFFLRPARAALATITGADTPLSLGAVRTTAQASVFSTPIVAEVGVLPRLAVSVTVPLVQTRTAVAAVVNEGGRTGNAGLNPARFGSTAQTARTQNAAVQTAFTAAIDALQQRIASGAVTDPAAAALVGEATQVRAALATLYGTTTANTGAAAVPVAGSAAQQAVVARIAQLSGRFAGYGVTALPATTVPAAATARIAAPGLNGLLSDPTVGIGTDSLELVRRNGIGDVDALASVTWLDTFGARTRASRFAGATGFAVRSTASLGWRFPSTFVDAPFLYLDVPAGTGASGPIARLATDLAFGPRLLVSVVGRATSPLQDEFVVRIPFAAGDPFPAAFGEQTVERQLGREWELEFTPRLTVGRQVALFGQFVHRQRAADRYAGTFTIDDATSGIGEVTLDAGVLGIGTAGREERAGLGLIYSTMSAWAEGRSRLPVEISYVHLVSLAGSGGATPRQTIDAISLRVYVPLFGAARRR